MKLSPFGDQAIRVTFESGPETVERQVFALTSALQRETPLGITDTVAGFETVTVTYDPLVCGFESAAALIETAAKAAPKPARPEPAREIVVPVRFGGVDGEDLASVAETLALTGAALISRFVEPVYTVRVIGFLPGFPYLSGLPESLAMPRRATPRLAVPAGSVAIAGRQAGIYPSVSPGGWHLLGRTDLALFDPAADPPARPPGDTVRFTAII